MISFPSFILTYCMVQSPSWEPNWFAASQEIPRLSRKPKVHYRTHKRPPPISVPGQPNPIHLPTSHFMEIHPNITHPSTPRTPSDLFPSGFPTKNLYTPLSSPIRATCPAHLILLDFITRTVLGDIYYTINYYTQRGWEQILMFCWSCISQPAHRTASYTVSWYQMLYNTIWPPYDGHVMLETCRGI